MFVSHLYVFFGEMSVWFFGSFFDWVIYFSQTELHELLLRLILLSVASFAIIFSHSEGCLFTLLRVSFVVQKLLSLTRSHFSFLLLFPLLWGWVIEDPAVIYVRECFAYVFL